MTQNKQVVNPAQAITMTSLQIVDYINDERKQVAAEGGKKYTELKHNDFLKKVPVVLGEVTSGKFFSHVNIEVGNGAVRQSPVYLLPKREASLLAMSYSFALQAKVYDHMTALEEALKEAQVFKLPDFTSPVESARAWAIEYRPIQPPHLVSANNLARYVS